MDPVIIAQEGVEKFKDDNFEIIIVDTRCVCGGVNACVQYCTYMYACALFKNEKEREEERRGEGGGRERKGEGERMKARERERERGGERVDYLDLPSPVVVINKRTPCLKKCCKFLKQL